MKYIKRQMESSILEAAKFYPVIMVCGQRQTGKSTMLRHIAPADMKYVSFDDAKARSLAKNDPALFFETYGIPLFIDEFQREPGILMEIKRIVDEKLYLGENVNGIFFLSGSQKFTMMKNVSESLAGRVAVFNLLPLTRNEMLGIEEGCFRPELELLKQKNPRKETLAEIYKYIFVGGLPKLAANQEINRDLYYSSYMNTYIERDISALEQIGKLDEFRAFVTYMAANTAQELKYDAIAKVVGVSAPTIKEWVSILERSGIIYILRPYANSMSKRLVKTPKCYFIDTGLAAYLTSWPTPETLMNGNASGAFFETFVVTEILKTYYNTAKEPNLYYYRDFEQKEIDILIVEGDRVYPIEIKKGKSPSNPDKNFSALNKFNLQVMPGLVVCSADELFPISRKAWITPVSLV